MKVTIDIPEPLYRRFKAKAAADGRTTEPGPVDIDADIWVATRMDDEPDHLVARRFVGTVIRRCVSLEQPTITLVEVASALRRRGASRAGIERCVAWLAGLRGSTYHDLDLRAAIDAAETAMVTGGARRTRSTWPPRAGPVPR